MLFFDIWIFLCKMKQTRTKRKHISHCGTKRGRGIVPRCYPQVKIAPSDEERMRQEDKIENKCEWSGIHLMEVVCCVSLLINVPPYHWDQN